MALKMFERGVFCRLFCKLVKGLARGKSIARDKRLDVRAIF